MILLFTVGLIAIILKFSSNSKYFSLEEKNIKHTGLTSSVTRYSITIVAASVALSLIPVLFSDTRTYNKTSNIEAMILPRFVLAQDTNISDQRARSLNTFKIQRITTNLDFFITFNNKYPENLSELTTCSKFDEKCQFVLTQDQLLDSWGNPFTLSCKKNENKVTCEVITFGADGKEGGEGANLDIKKIVSIKTENPTSSVNSASLPEPTVTGSKSKKYTGKIISLELSNIEIANALNIISESSNTPIKLDEGITGKFSLSILDVPSDEALDMILEKNGLDKIKESDAIRVFRKRN